MAGGHGPVAVDGDVGQAEKMAAAVGDIGLVLVAGHHGAQRAPAFHDHGVGRGRVVGAVLAHKRGDHVGRAAVHRRSVGGDQLVEGLG